MTKDPRVPLMHILERGERIILAVSRGRKAFESDLQSQDAVMHNFAIIGEAARRIPAEWRDQHPEVIWESLNAFRNVLIHQYDSIDMDRVWDAATTLLPRVLASIRALLPSDDQLEEEIGGPADQD